MQLCFLGGKGLLKTLGPILPLQPPTSLDADVWSYVYFLQLFNGQKENCDTVIVFFKLFLGYEQNKAVTMLQMHTAAPSEDSDGVS